MLTACSQQQSCSIYYNATLHTNAVPGLHCGNSTILTVASLKLELMQAHGLIATVHILQFCQVMLGASACAKAKNVLVSAAGEQADLSDAVIHFHGAAPHAEGLGSLALLGHSLRGEVRAVCVLAQLPDDSVRNMVLVKLHKATHEA